MTARTPTRRGWYPLAVDRLDRLAEDTVAVTLHVPAPLTDVFAHRPGQHVVIRHRGGGADLRRSYSVCPPPADRHQLRLVIGRGSPGGFGAHALHRLGPGHLLDVAPPTGTFGLTPAAHHVLVAGGTGIAPLLPMAAAALADDPHCRVSLLYASRDTLAVLLAGELADLKDTHLDRFTVLHVLTREQREADLLSGRIDRERLPRLLAALGIEPGAEPHLGHGAGTAYYLCGPFGMVEAARGALVRAGVPPHRVRAELFSTEGAPDPPAPPAPLRQGVRITARLAGRTSTAEMRPGDAVVLDALLRVRPDTPYSCRTGLCGSCRARITRGRAAMGRQFALDPAELAAGYTLACRARPQTDDLALDFDT